MPCARWREDAPAARAPEYRSIGVEVGGGPAGPGRDQPGWRHFGGWGGGGQVDGEALGHGQPGGVPIRVPPGSVAPAGAWSVVALAPPASSRELVNWGRSLSRRAGF